MSDNDYSESSAYADFLKSHSHVELNTMTNTVDPYKPLSPGEIRDSINNTEDPVDLNLDAPFPSTGGNNDYYVVDVDEPIREEHEPYTAECGDIILALDMSFHEGEIFKGLWRKCAQRLGNGKPDNTPKRDAEKIKYAADILLRRES